MCLPLSPTGHSIPNPTDMHTYIHTYIHTYACIHMLTSFLFLCLFEVLRRPDLQFPFVLSQLLRLFHTGLAHMFLEFCESYMPPRRSAAPYYPDMLLKDMEEVWFCGSFSSLLVEAHTTPARRVKTNTMHFGARQRGCECVTLAW